MPGGEWIPLFSEHGFMVHEVKNQPQKNEAGAADLAAQGNTEQKGGGSRIIEMTFDDQRPSPAVLGVLLKSISTHLGERRTAVELLPLGEDYPFSRATGWELLGILARSEGFPDSFVLNWGKKPGSMADDGVEATAVYASGDQHPVTSLEIRAASFNPGIDPVVMAHEVIEGLTHEPVEPAA